MNRRDLHYRIKDLEAEYDYYNLYEPDDRESADRIKREIDDAYDELDFKIKETKENEDFDSVFDVPNPLTELKKKLNDDN